MWYRRTATGLDETLHVLTPQFAFWPCLALLALMAHILVKCHITKKLSSIAILHTLPKLPPHLFICIDMQMGAMLDDRKILARALFDYNSQRQTLMGVTVCVGQTMCYMLPFHVFVSLTGLKINEVKDNVHLTGRYRKKGLFCHNGRRTVHYPTWVLTDCFQRKVFYSLFLFFFIYLGYSWLHPTYQLHFALQNQWHRERPGTRWGMADNIQEVCECCSVDLFLWKIGI